MTTATPQIHIMPRLSSSFVVNNDWCIDDDGDGLGDYAKTTTTTTTTKTRMSENQRKRERRKRNEVVDNEGNNLHDDVRSYFATCIPGLHETLASELLALGAHDVKTTGKSGVRFSGSTRVGLKSLLWCRTAHRIMELVVASSAPSLSSSNYLLSPTNNHNIILNIDIIMTLRRGYAIATIIPIHTFSFACPKSPGQWCWWTTNFVCVNDLCRVWPEGTITQSLHGTREMRDDGERPDVDVHDSDVPLVVVWRGRKVGGEDDSRRGGGGRRGYSNNNNNKDDRYGGALMSTFRWEFASSGVPRTQQIW